MKIDKDLRIAIRSAVNQQPSRADFTKGHEQTKQRITAACKKIPALGAAMRQFVRANKSREDARTAMTKYGVYSHDHLNESVFQKKCGLRPTVATTRFTFDSVMAELAAAEPKQALAILRKYGINWK